MTKNTPTLPSIKQSVFINISVPLFLQLYRPWSTSPPALCRCTDGRMRCLWILIWRVKPGVHPDSLYIPANHPSGLWSSSLSHRSVIYLRESNPTGPRSVSNPTQHCKLQPICHLSLFSPPVLFAGLLRDPPCSPAKFPHLTSTRFFIEGEFKFISQHSFIGIQGNTKQFCHTKLHMHAFFMTLLVFVWRWRNYPVTFSHLSLFHLIIQLSDPVELHLKRCSQKMQIAPFLQSAKNFSTSCQMISTMMMISNRL